jgi:hypothetical protein
VLYRQDDSAPNRFSPRAAGKPQILCATEGAMRGIATVAVDHQPSSTDDVCFGDPFRTVAGNEQLGHGQRWCTRRLIEADAIPGTESIDDNGLAAGSLWYPRSRNRH